MPKGAAAPRHQTGESAMSLSESRVKYDRRDPRMDALPEGIAIETIMGCNLRCPMCAVPNPETEMNGRKVTLMSMEMFQSIIAQISDRPRAVMLTIMGEPLLHPHIVEFATIAKQAGHHTALITNGTRLTREKSVAFIEAGLDHLTMSVDGLTKETYEKQRIGGKHDIVLKNLDDLIEANAERGNPMRIDLNYVVTDGTRHETEAFYRAFSARVRKINFLPLTDWGGQLEMPAALGTPVRVAGRQRTVCYALWGTMFISAEGRAMLCCADFRQETRLGSVAERPLLDIWRTDVEEHRRRHVDDNFNSAPCATCRLNVVDVRIPGSVRRGMLRKQRVEQTWRAAVPDRVLPEWVKARRRRKDVPYGHIDVPAADTVVSGLVPVEGWALPHHSHAMERVDVRVDGVRVGEAEWGFPRSDAGEMHPGEGHSFCAFGYLLDSRTLSNGPHTIDIVVTDNAAHQAVLGRRSITVANAAVTRRTQIPLHQIS
jgi:radical SAM protein with 4Fe4S-binding SPASM domain